jgi:hypothetical protein
VYRWFFFLDHTILDAIENPIIKNPLRLLYWKKKIKIHREDSVTEYLIVLARVSTYLCRTHQRFWGVYIRFTTLCSINSTYQVPIRTRIDIIGASSGSPPLACAPHLRTEVTTLTRSMLRYFSWKLRIADAQPQSLNWTAVVAFNWCSVLHISVKRSQEEPLFVVVCCECQWGKYLFIWVPCFCIKVAVTQEWVKYDIIDEPIIL